MSEQVILFDTTLRDGEQMPGVSFSVEDKVEIADELARYGIDVIEAGFPNSKDPNNPENNDFEPVRAVAETVGRTIYTVNGVDRTPTICGLARVTMEDIDRCWEAVEPADSARIHVFMATSDSHRKVKFGDASEEVMFMRIREGVSHAASYTDNVEFSPEDATRTGFGFMIRSALTAVEAGATTINIPDTNGIALPHIFGPMIARAREAIHAVNPDVVVSVHCHDDKDMATANSIVGVAHGARQVEGTITGIGERAGNTPLEAVAAIIREDGEELGVHTGVDTTRSQVLARFIEEKSGIFVPANTAVVGANAYTHKSGIHAAAVLKDPSTYGGLPADHYGAEVRIAEGKTSGGKGRAFVEEFGEEQVDRSGMRIAVVASNR